MSVVSVISPRVPLDITQTTRLKDGLQISVSCLENALQPIRGYDLFWPNEIMGAPLRRSHSLTRPHQCSIFFTRDIFLRQIDSLK
jgi:hypothetical protein